MVQWNLSVVSPSSYIGIPELKQYPIPLKIISDILQIMIPFITNWSSQGLDNTTNRIISTHVKSLMVTEFAYFGHLVIVCQQHYQDTDTSFTNGIWVTISIWKIIQGGLKS